MRHLRHPSAAVPWAIWQRYKWRVMRCNICDDVVWYGVVYNDSVNLSRPAIGAQLVDFEPRSMLSAILPPFLPCLAPTATRSNGLWVMSEASGPMYAIVT